MFKKLMAAILVIAFLAPALAFAQAKTVVRTVTTETGYSKPGAPYVEPLYGMVVKFDGGNIVTNLGQTKNIKAGTVFYVYRVKNYIGKVEVYQVEGWTSLAKIISLEKGQTINRGDRLSDKELEFVGDAVYVKGARTETTVTSVTSDTPGKMSVENVDASAPKYKKEKVTSLEDIYKRHTKTCEFSAKGQPTNKLELPQVNIPGVPEAPAPPVPAYSSHGFVYNPYGFNLMDALQIAGFTSIFFNPNTQAVFNSNWPLYSSLGFTVYTRMNTIQNYQKSMGMIKKVTISVTKMDEQFAYDISSYYAYKNAIYDENKINQGAEAIIKDMKIREKLVFLVQITSKEQTAAVFSPWNQHMFLVDKDGRRIKTSDYSRSLDSNLGTMKNVITTTDGKNMDLYNNLKGTSGFVYYDKSYDTGEVKINLEDIFGKDTTMTFD